MLFVRRQRLQSAGGFSLLLLHCLCHVKVNDMNTDSSPAFQRLFYKVHTNTQHQVLTIYSELMRRTLQPESTNAALKKSNIIFFYYKLASGSLNYI